MTEPPVRFLTTLGATGAVESRDLGRKAALGIFFRFQIPDFNLFLGFFSLRHLFPFFVGLCFFSDTEEHLMAALNVFLWNQIVEANQFICWALAPSTS